MPTNLSVNLPERFPEGRQDELMGKLAFASVRGINRLYHLLHIQLLLSRLPHEPLKPLRLNRGLLVASAYAHRADNERKALGTSA